MSQKLINKICKDIIPLKNNEKPLIIGVDGPTAAGKTFLAKNLKLKLRQKFKSIWICQLDWALKSRNYRSSSLKEYKKKRTNFYFESQDHMNLEKIHKNLFARTGFHLGVIINDSIGRAWRNGTIGTAIGVAGLPAILDLKGRDDLFGNPLQVSEQAIADELASAASLIQGQADEALPVVLIKGFKTLLDNIPASGLIRDIKKDLFL